MSARHREALAHLGYGAESGSGFVLLSGEVGTGKTTLCRYLADNLPDHVDIALCINPHVTGAELFATICQELGVVIDAESPGLADYTYALNTHLLDQYAKGRRAVLIIDEAQNLSFELLEQVRMLTNLETTHNKLLQIILIGQTELRDLLKQTRLRQLSQRITARYHLTPMNKSETRGYIAHRTDVSGMRKDTFDHAAMDVIHVRAKGIPRLINSISERCLLGAYAKNQHVVNESMANTAADEVLGDIPQKQSSQWLGIIAASVLGILIAALTLHTQKGQRLFDHVTQTDFVASLNNFMHERGTSSEAALPVLQVPSGYLTSFGAGLDTIATEWSRLGVTEQSVNSCLKARVIGLACMTIEGDWELIRRINHPTIVVLKSAQDVRRYIGVFALQGDIVHYRLAGESFQTPFDALSEYWDQPFTVLWQRPKDFERTLQRGMVGDDVIWLRSLLDKALSLRTSETDYPAFYDDELLAVINSFKQSAGLSADGLVTPVTVLLLIEDAGYGYHPVLHDAPSDAEI